MQLNSFLKILIALSVSLTVEVEGDKLSKATLCGLHICCMDREQLMQLLELVIKSNLSLSKHKNCLFVAIRTTRETNCQHPVCKQTNDAGPQAGEAQRGAIIYISSEEAGDPLKMFFFPLTAEQLRVTCVRGHDFERWFFWIFRNILAKKSSSGLGFIFQNISKLNAPTESWKPLACQSQ